MLPFDKTEIETRSERLSQCQGTTSKKLHSLIPDLATGWKPKNIKIPSPIIIKYKSQLTQQLIEYYGNQQDKIVYLGPRFTNSFKFHEQIAHQYHLRYGISSQDIPKFISKQLADDAQHEKARPFEGMNPNIQSNLAFDSQFESGNLDLVVKVNQHEYNLFLRPDTNTCGHMQWFYFTVKNKQKARLKLNICNNKKAKTLYQRGMKPYVLSRYARQNRGVHWEQTGQCLSYSKLELKQFGQQKLIEGEIKQVGRYQDYFCLSFQYQFESDNDEVSFAYCPPYTFSRLKNYILSIKKNYNCFETIITEQKFCSSLSGLDVPILTITDPLAEDQDKMYIVVIGRIHPGQANASHVLQGFINHIISDQARQMRKKVIFKIIPMINPDGVIFGNYRTSLSGKDLNRQFRAKNQQLIPEVRELKTYMKKLKYDSNEKVCYFLDFHGHSQKKNVFFYGPEYDIWSIKYEKAKVLPKLVAAKTEMFRMKSCEFKVANFKKSTARAFMLAYIPYCYTIESSVGIYRDIKQEDHFFNIRKWKEAGGKIGEAFTQVVAKLVENTNNAIKRKEKKIKKSDNSPQPAKQNENESLNKFTEKSTASLTSKKYLNPIRHLKKRPIEQSTEMNKIQEQQCESDHFSEGNSDCESDNNDLPKIQYDSLKDKIVNLIDTFQIVMMGKKKTGLSLEKKERRVIKMKKIRQQSKKSSECMILVPSLKHKLNKMTLSEKKISFLNTLGGLNNTESCLLPRAGSRLQKIAKQ